MAIRAPQENPMHVGQRDSYLTSKVRDSQLARRAATGCETWQRADCTSAGHHHLHVARKIWPWVAFASFSRFHVGPPLETVQSASSGGPQRDLFASHYS